MRFEGLILEGLKVWYESGKFYRLRNLPRSGIFLKRILMSFRKIYVRFGWFDIVYPRGRAMPGRLATRQGFPTLYQQLVVKQ
jgi:hypothetical protein